MKRNVVAATMTGDSSLTRISKRTAWLATLSAELFGGALAGVVAPEIGGELSSDGDDRFLAGGAGGLSPFGEEEEPLWMGG